MGVSRCLSLCLCALVFSSSLSLFLSLVVSLSASLFVGVSLFLYCSSFFFFLSFFLFLSLSHLSCSVWLFSVWLPWSPAMWFFALVVLCYFSVCLSLFCFLVPVVLRFVCSFLSCSGFIALFSFLLSFSVPGFFSLSLFLFFLHSSCCLLVLFLFLFFSSFWLVVSLFELRLIGCLVCFVVFVSSSLLSCVFLLCFCFSLT